MFVGSFRGNSADGRGSDALLSSLLNAVPASGSDQVKVWSSGPLTVAWVPDGVPTLDETNQPYQNHSKTVTVFFAGKIYNHAEVARSLGGIQGVDDSVSGSLIPALYERDGENFVAALNGKFAIALWDSEAQKLILVRDRLGIEPLYLFRGEEMLFSTSLRPFLSGGLIDARISNSAVVQYLLYCYNPAEQTILEGVKKLKAGHHLIATESASQMSRYWKLSFSEQYDKSESQYQQEFMDLIVDAVQLRLRAERPPTFFLSGGTDSSTLLGVSSRLTDQPLNAVGFRCVGPQYDESPYAQFVADHFGAAYRPVDYGPEKLHRIESAVDWMDEPFCDLGIEIGTFIMGEASAGGSGYVFSGEGGDELFAGHPVYIADKAARFVDIFPSFFVGSVARLLQKLEDSHHKKDLKVKLKRFAYSVAFPKKLLSHRWRIYYTKSELRKLCAPEFLESVDFDAMYDGILESMEGADGRDQLANSLYSDYFTLVAFYLSRLRLLRAFGVESRLPLLDHRLVEYAAKIPSKLKIKGLADTKYIYKRILEPLLPRKILYERPKLGHGVPMKNWFRDDPEFIRWTSEVLGSGELRKRGYFSESFINQMLNEHRQKKFNHSHRIWALLVLDLWLAKHLPVK